MSDERETQKKIKPHDTLGSDDYTNSWLASVWMREEICQEWDWLELTPDSFSEIWVACRWTTEEERADPDGLYDLFGCDPDEIDTSIYYWRVPTETEGAHRYWTIDP